MILVCTIIGCYLDIETSMIFLIEFCGDDSLMARTNWRICDYFCGKAAKGEGEHIYEVRLIAVDPKAVSTWSARMVSCVSNATCHGSRPLWERKFKLHQFWRRCGFGVVSACMISWRWMRRHQSRGVLHNITSTMFPSLCSMWKRAMTKFV